MMGIHDGQQPLFYSGISLDERVPAEHPLRRIKELIDFSFVRREVVDSYGRRGNVSVDPQIILKLLFLLFFDDIKSERELMRQLAYRLDYLWFLDMRLDESIPDHSVLSKARARWGRDVFESVFVRTVQQCIEASLVDGSKVHMDSTLVDADASKDSVKKGSPELVATLRRLFSDQEQKFEEEKPSSQDEDEHSDGDQKGVNRSLVSTTDPDATVARDGLHGPRLRYKHHRVVDDVHGVITAVETTTGSTNEGHRLVPLIDQHEQITGRRVKTVVADSKYGTIENFIACESYGIRSHMTDLQSKQNAGKRRANIFSDKLFIYEGETDTYRCPAGQHLSRRSHHKRRRSWEYAASIGVCAACHLRSQCTQSKTGRTIKRHYEQARIDHARQQSRSLAARRDRRRRKHLIEGSFARGANDHHLKRSRWRRRWRQQIQDLLIASVQNIKILINAMKKKPRKAIVMAMGLLGDCWAATNAFGRNPIAHMASLGT